MKYQIGFNAFQLAPIVSVVLATLCICLYWFLCMSTKFKTMCMRRRIGEEGVVLHMMLLKVAALLIMGVIPYLIFMTIAPGYSWKRLGISFNSRTSLYSVEWIAGLGAGTLLLARVSGRKHFNFVRYPQMRVEAWDLRLIFKYCVSVAIYFLGHEMLFRGLLLFPLADHYGFWFTIAVNTGLCTLFYLPKGPPETISALVLGPLFCFITLQTGTIWASWIIHSMVAMAYSMLALRYHPVFSIVWNRRPTTDETEL